MSSTGLDAALRAFDAAHLRPCAWRIADAAEWYDAHPFEERVPAPIWRHVNIYENDIREAWSFSIVRASERRYSADGVDWWGLSMRERQDLLAADPEVARHWALTDGYYARLVAARRRPAPAPNRRVTVHARGRRPRRRASSSSRTSGCDPGEDDPPPSGGRHAGGHPPRTAAGCGVCGARLPAPQAFGGRL